MDTTLRNLTALIAAYACVPAGSINLTDPLADIGLDSIDHAQLVIEIEEHFQIELPESADLTTVAALHDAIQQAIITPA